MSTALSTKEMTVYLKQAMDLEVSAYSQERAINKSKKYLNKKKPKYIEPDKPQYPEHKEIVEPQKPELQLIDVAYQQKLLKKERRSNLARSLFAIAVSIICSALMISCIFGYASEDNAFLLVLIILFFVIGAISISYGLMTIYLIIQDHKIAPNFEENNTKATAIYEEKMKQYEEEMREYEIALEQEEKRYVQETEKVKKKYNKDKEEAKIKYKRESKAHSLATNAVNQMRAPLAETKNTLEQLYAIGVIFPKYRNLVAVSTMYEYFASGRVSELEGPNGAYNLYEAEVRQNLIINKLDVIITQLEDIKANQYALYIELQATNRTLEGIADDVKRIANSADRIADNTSDIADNTRGIAEASHITAYCAQVTANNTEALKYIALINS